MSDLAAIEKALRAADAAGNTEDARRLAQAYAQARASQQSPQPDFSSARTGSSAVVGAGGRPSPRPAARPAAPKPKRYFDAPAETVRKMPAFFRFVHGVGDGIEGITGGIEQLGNALDAKLLGNRRAADRVRESQQYETYRRQRNDQAGGLHTAGRVTADVAAFALPVTKIDKMETFGRRLLGNATLGAGAGVMQPTIEGESRGQNAIVGSVAGGLGGAVGEGLGAGYRGAKNIVRPFTRAGREQAAARRVQSFATDADSLLRPAPSRTQGVQRNLAEESLDPGIASLTNSMGARNAARSTIESANNLHQVRALEKIARTPDELAAAVSQRARATNPLYEKVREGKVDTTQFGTRLSELIDQSRGNPQVTNALSDMKAMLKKADGSAEDAASVLLNMRDDIGHKLSGAGGQMPKNARALMQARDALDETLGQVPGWRAANDTYAELSGPIARMKIGQYLAGQKSGSAILDPRTRVQVLTPAKFSGNARAMDSVAAKATGFRKAKASDYLSSDDMAIISGIQDDIERTAFANTQHGAKNSPTGERLDIQGLLKEEARNKVIGGIPIVGKIVNGLADMNDKAVQSYMISLINDPAQYRAVAATLTGPQRLALERAMAQLSAGGSVLSANALASPSPQ